MSAPALACRGVTVSYGDDPVLQDVDLDCPAGATVALLGPSGSGKTTLLHAIAGFIRPLRGRIAIGGRLVAGEGADVPPERRDIGFVFQHYALWPHLSALDTVAFPLRRSGLAGRVARQRAFALLEAMSVADLADRRPAQLSGGQQQRVGLARALARDAAVYLLDEPTAHLDTALRTALQTEVAVRRTERSAAAVYATHDAGEALAVADRVVLLRAGRVVQTGPPEQVYAEPVDLWAAQLTGPAAVLDGEVLAGRDGARLLVAGGAVPVDGTSGAGWRRALVRPDWARLGGPLAGRIEQVWYRGPHTDYRVATPSGDVIVRDPGAPRARPGDAVGWSLDRVHLLRGPAAEPSVDVLR